MLNATHFTFDPFTQNTNTWGKFEYFSPESNYHKLLFVSCIPHNIVKPTSVYPRNYIFFKTVFKSLADSHPIGAFNPLRSNKTLNSTNILLREEWRM